MDNIFNLQPIGTYIHRSVKNLIPEDSWWPDDCIILLFLSINPVKEPTTNKSDDYGI